MGEYMKLSSLTFLTEPFTWFAVFILVENIFIIRMFIRWRTGSGFGISALKFLGCVGLSIALIIVTLIVFASLSNFTNRRSKVDASPLAELSIEQVGHLDEVIEKLKDYDFISSFRYDPKPKRKIIETGWRRENPPSSLHITICTFKDEKDAISNIRSSSSMGTYGTRITNDNNTEALLFDSRMITTSDTLYFPHSERYIRSIIRLGNATITLTEYQKYYHLNNDISSEFIELLCELLKEEG